MQWLIDLVIEAIGVPPVYVHRGCRTVHDWVLGSFTIDGARHELDLSAIVPEGITGVVLHSSFRSTNVSETAYFFPTACSSNVASCSARTQAANITNCFRRVFAIGPDRKLTYLFVGNGWNMFNMSVKGWFI